MSLLPKHFKTHVIIVTREQSTKKENGWLFECHYVHRIIFESIIQIIASALWNKARKAQIKRQRWNKDHLSQSFMLVFNEIDII